MSGTHLPVNDPQIAGWDGARVPAQSQHDSRTRNMDATTAHARGQRAPPPPRGLGFSRLGPAREAAPRDFSHSQWSVRVAAGCRSLC